MVGNSRLTGAAGALLFVLLAVEGVTILRVHSLVALHIFVGMVLAPVAVLKTLTTGYRFIRYYTGDAAYVRKGAPPTILRVAGPFVVVLTFAVLATGVGAAVDGPGTWLLRAHKASFILWFGVTTVHVLGHIVETPGLAMADWRGSTRRAVPDARWRLTLLVASLVLGVVLGAATRSWTHAWQGVQKIGDALRSIP